MSERYAPAARLERLRTILRSRASTLAAIGDDLGVSESTARRLLAALEAAGEPLSEETSEAGRKTWRILPTGRDHVVRLSTSQLVTFVLAHNAVHYLRGTGFDADLGEVRAALMATLGAKDAALLQNLDRKLYDLGEGGINLEDKADALDEIVTALLREERLDLRRKSRDGTERTHAFDPYTLATYKKGLYLLGYSHDHASVISLGLDGVLEATRRKGERFAYPADYRPADLFDGAFGMHAGPRTKVRIRFDGVVARYVARRNLHPSQRTEEAPDGAVDLLLEVAGTTELESFVLSFGEHAEVLEPPALRRKIAKVVEKAAARYRG
jgi:proteasome accessory factor B